MDLLCCFASCQLSKFHSPQLVVSPQINVTKCLLVTVKKLIFLNTLEKQRLSSFRLFNNLILNHSLTGVQHIPEGYIYSEASLLL